MIRKRAKNIVHEIELCAHCCICYLWSKSEGELNKVETMLKSVTIERSLLEGVDKQVETLSVLSLNSYNLKGRVLSERKN